MSVALIETKLFTNLITLIFRSMLIRTFFIVWRVQFALKITNLFFLPLCIIQNTLKSHQQCKETQ